MGIFMQEIFLVFIVIGKHLINSIASFVIICSNPPLVDITLETSEMSFPNLFGIELRHFIRVSNNLSKNCDLENTPNQCNDKVNQIKRSS